MALVTALVAIAASGTGPRATHAAEAKPAWQVEWEKVLAAAKKEGQVAVYISGYEEILPEFQKEYPEIKVSRPRAEAPRSASVCSPSGAQKSILADVVNAGGVTTFQQLFPAKVFDPIKPALLLPEINDTSKWYQGKHHYSDPENQYIFDYVATATYGAISYNTKLVNVKDFKSYWDLLAPKWKGKIISRDIRVSGPGSGNARLFYHLPDVGPTFIRKLYGEMDVTLFRDYRQGSDWLAVGKAALCFFCEADVSKQQGLPVDTIGPGVFKEGAGLVSQFGTLGLVNRAPHPNAAKVFINWLLSRKGQSTVQKIMSVHGESRRLLADRYSQRRGSGAPTTLRRREVFRHQPAGVAGYETDLGCHERGAESGGEELIENGKWRIEN